MSLPLETLHEKIVSHVEALSAAAFALDQRSGGEAEAWGHSRAPFEDDSTAGKRSQHLEFVAEVVSVTESDEQRGRGHRGVMLDAQIDVVFDFRVQPNTQVADYRKAMEAARLLCSSLRNVGAYVPGLGVLYLRCRERFRPEPSSERLTFKVRTSHMYRYTEGL